MTLLIDGIIADGLIGCYTYERGMTQPVEVSLKLSINKPDYADDITSTVDYSELCDYVKNLITLNHYHLVENLARQIAANLLKTYPLIDQIEVNVSKPNINNKKARRISCTYAEQRQHKIALALGSNLNNPKQQLISAIEFLAEFVTNIKIAPFYKSTPSGYSQQDDFYNTCISGYVTVSPQQLLINIKKIEKMMGKMEQFTNGPRVIDIDIILYDDLNYQEMFINIPHPRMHERDFVIIPLAQIEAEWVHPQLNKKIRQLQEELKQDQQFILHKLD